MGCVYFKCISKFWLSVVGFSTSAVLQPVTVEMQNIYVMCGERSERDVTSV